jgi:NAD(P)-dependent dehydrogenase (short-subunit alcohol dehydrogenase family)
MPAAGRNRGSATTTSAAPARAADFPAPAEGFGIVITGGTKGVGYAMAREFLARGDRVCICGRSQIRVDNAVKALRAEFPGRCVAGAACDVTDPRDVDDFGDFAASTVGTIHHWLNNAGMVSARETLLDVEPSEVVRVCNTNLTGAVLCCQKAAKIMVRQRAPKTSSSSSKNASVPFHVYNFGFSTWGASFSKSTCTHKATKRGLSQLTTSLVEELASANVETVGVHQLSPGMVLTDLLLEGAEPVAKRFFNVLAEEPETVAKDLVPKIRNTFTKTSAVEFLTLQDAVFRVVFGVPQILNGGKFFDGDGVRVAREGELYKPNGVRLLYEEMK